METIWQYINRSSQEEAQKGEIRARKQLTFVKSPGWPKMPELGQEKAGPRDELLARGLQATTPEAIVYLWLEKLSIPFEFQSVMLGGRTMPGGFTVDFIVLDREPPLLLRVQGTYWHSGLGKMGSDEEQKLTMQAMGYKVVDLWERWIYENIEYVMQMAMAGMELGQ